MPLNAQCIGKEYGPYSYRLGLEKMREFTFAVSGGVPSLGQRVFPPTVSPLLFDEEAARQGPYGAVIAFPTFACVFASAPFGAAMEDPEVGVDFLRLVHGEQEFEFFDVMREGDVMTTTGRIEKIQERSGMDFLVVRSQSFNQRGVEAVRALWTAVIRRG